MWRVYLFALLGGVGASGCAARYVLSDTQLNVARKLESFERVRAFPSNRTIAVYDRDLRDRIVVGSEFDRDKWAKRRKVVIRRGTQGKIVAEEQLNGRPLLWVSYTPMCNEVECAFGYVQTGDGKYSLVNVPALQGYEPVKAYRGWVAKRRKMEKGKLQSLGDANAVYRLRKRRRLVRRVFLELKESNRDHVVIDKDVPPGYPGAR